MIRFVAKINPAVIWFLIVTQIVLAEGVFVAQNRGGSLSEVTRTDIRFDAIGRFPFIALMYWLLYHWVFRGPNGPAFGRWDMLVIALGIVHAALEAHFNIII